MDINFNTVRILLLYDKEYWFGSTDNYLKRWHGWNTTIFHISIHALISSRSDEKCISDICAMIQNNQFGYIYIIPQSRRIRQQIRQLFRERTGKDTHIKIFSKLVEAVRRNSMRKSVSIDEVRKALQQHEPTYVTIARSSEEYTQLRKLGFKDNEILRQFKEEMLHQFKEEGE